MLKLRTKPKQDPVTITHRIQGQEITLVVNPWDQDEVEKIRAKHTHYEFTRDPDTLQMVRVPIKDTGAIGRDVFDLLLASFSGVELDGKTLEVTAGNKEILSNIPPLPGETAINTVVLRTSQQLERTIEVEREAEIKNSVTSPESTAAR